MLTPIPPGAALWRIVTDVVGGAVGFVTGFVGAAWDQRGGRWRRGR